MRHFYLGIENVGLNATQRDTFIDALKALGPPWQSALHDTNTPIVITYDSDGEIESVTGGDPIQRVIYFHGGMPAHFNHWRVRLDNQAIILEAMFNEDNLTVGAFKNKLADIFSVSPATITDAVNQTAYGPMVTFAYNSSDKLRFLLFGGVNASVEESRAACTSYLSANILEWDTGE